MTNKSNFDFDYNPQAEQSKPVSPKLEVWDILSILVLLMTCGIVVYFGIIFFNPASALNPLPPVVMVVYQSPTPTITPLGLEPTWTPPPTPIQSPSATLAPTFTPIPSPTSFSLTPPSATPTVTNTATATNTPKAPFSATVDQVQSDIFPHLQSAACNWQGVGGSVVDANNSDIIGMTVRLVGSYNGKTVDIITVSGISTDYGRSGFEFVLGTIPITSRGKLYLQLLDQASGLPLADNVYIDTSDDCKKNLVLVHFKKNR
jgi:hypothetical protein